MPSYIGGTCTTCGGLRPCRRHRSRAVRLLADVAPPTVALLAAVLLGVYVRPWLGAGVALVATVLALRVLLSSPDTTPTEPPAPQPDPIPPAEVEARLREGKAEWYRNLGGDR